LKVGYDGIQQLHRDRFAAGPVHGQHRLEGTEVQVPPPHAFLAEPEPGRASGYRRLPGPAVQDDGLEIGVLAVVAQPVGGQELARPERVWSRLERHQERRVGEPRQVLGEVRHLPVDQELPQDHVSHRHR